MIRDTGEKPISLTQKSAPAAADLDTLLFFEGHRAALPLFEALDNALTERFPEAKKRGGSLQFSVVFFENTHCIPACVML